MIAFQTQQPYLQSPKPIAVLNHPNINFQPNYVMQNKLQVYNTLNSPLNPQMVQDRRRYQTPIPVKINGVANNGINRTTIKTMKSILPYDVNNLQPVNYVNKTAPNPNKVKTIARNQIINGPMNVVTNQNIQNLINVSKVQNPMNSIVINPQVINNDVNTTTITLSKLVPNNGIINNKANIQNQINTIILKKVMNPINGVPQALINNNNQLTPLNTNLNIMPQLQMPQFKIQPQLQMSQIKADLGQVNNSLAQSGNPLTPQNRIDNNNIFSANNSREPGEKINLLEYKVVNEIGKGTFGKIYKVIWLLNNKFYALKKEILKDIEGVKAREHRNEAIRNFIRQTNCKGIVNVYGNMTIPNGKEFQYFELMELCENDFEKEILARAQYNKFYTEIEFHNIMLQLISTLAFLQKCHITHRDIKPQNILISNGIYKLCDFGDIRVMQRDGIVVQRVRGSELYMSPILFHGLRNRLLQVRHNTYKSDVFSLGMCLFLAASLTYDGLVEIRELTDNNKKLFILNKYLASRYSPKLIKILNLMLLNEENNRPDFILLEAAIRQYGL